MINFCNLFLKHLKVPIFSIDYGLAPKHSYPKAFDDCFQSYLWILTNVETYFSIYFCFFVKYFLFKLQEINKAEKKTILFFIFFYLFIFQIQEIKPKKIIIAGDSAGGNLAVNITMRCIKYGIRIPDGLLLSYPGFY